MKTRKISIRLTEEQHSEIMEYCEGAETTTANLIRALLQMFLLTRSTSRNKEKA